MQYNMYILYNAQLIICHVEFSHSSTNTSW